MDCGTVLTIPGKKKYFEMQNTISGNLHTEPNIDKPSPEIAKTQVKILLSEDLILERAKNKTKEMVLPKPSVPESDFSKN